MNQEIHSIPCILHGNEPQDRPHAAWALACIGKCNQIPLKNISNYSELLAHGYHMIEQKGISVEELENAYLETPNPEYCKNMTCNMNSLKSRKELFIDNESALPCLICPFGNPENAKRKELETVVITALSERNLDTSDIIHAGNPSEIFLSWTAATFKDHSGPCPIIRLHYHLYPVLFYLLFLQTSPSLNPDTIASFFNQLYFSELQQYAALHSKQITELAECFYRKICALFHPSHNKTREDALHALHQLKKTSVPKRRISELSFQSGKPDS